MKCKKKLKTLIVGGGMYTIGRGTDSFGTIIPAVFEAYHKGYIDDICIVTKRSESAQKATSKINELAAMMAVDIKCDYYPKEKEDTNAYLIAAKKFQPDIAVICVPDHLHAKVTLPLIDQGIHCLLVKPFAINVIEAKEMAFAAEKKGVVAQVEFHKRLDDSNRMLRDAVRENKLGVPLYAIIEYSQQKKFPSRFFENGRQKTNIFQYLGVHYVDLVQWITDFIPVRVTAWGQKQYLKEKGIDTWDAMQVVVEWDSGNGQQFVSTHITNWIDPNGSTAMSDQKINVVGTKGRYQADQKNRGVQIVTDENGVRDENPYFSKSYRSADSKRIEYHGYGIESIIQFIQDVLLFRNGKVTLKELDYTRPTFKVCIASTAVVEAALESILKNSIPVEIKL